MPVLIPFCRSRNIRFLPSCKIPSGTRRSHRWWKPLSLSLSWPNGWSIHEKAALLEILSGLECASRTFSENKRFLKMCAQTPNGREVREGTNWCSHRCRLLRSIVDKTRWNQGPKALEEAQSSVGIRTSRELNISPFIEKSSGHMELMRVHFQLEEKTRMAYSIHFQWEVKVHGFPQPSCKISSDRLPHSSETLVNATSAEKILSRTWISEYIVRNALCLVKKLQDAPRTEVKEYPIRSTREIQERPTARHHHWRWRRKPGRSTLE